MNKTPRPQVDPSVLAVLHRTQRVWRCLVVRTAGPGQAATTASPLSILDQREFAIDQASRIDGWLDTHKAARAIVILPAGSVICRTCPLPQAEPEQMDAALRLQAESYLLGQSLPHRTAMAVLHPAPGETTRCGLVLAWPASAAAETPPLNRPVTFAPDIAAIAALLDGERPSEALLWADRRNGSVALAMTHANGAVFRCTRENGDSADAWNANIGRIVGETALGAGHTGPFVESMVQKVRVSVAGMERDGSLLLLPADLISALNQKFGRPETAAWWSTWGIAVGAALATTDQLAPLTRMLDQPPVETPNVLDRAVSVLSNRRVAVMAAVVCAAVLLLLPLVASGARLLILNAKLPDPATYNKQIATAEARLVVYEELRQKTWPMTKLLADLACTMPEGIEVISISINKAGEEIRIIGKTEKRADRSAQENVLLMEKQMRGSGVFEGIRVNWGDADKFGNYEFDLFARARDAYHVAMYSPEQDFGAKTLKERKYGKPATELTRTDQGASETASESTPGLTNDSESKPPFESPRVVDQEPTDGEAEPVPRADRTRAPLGGGTRTAQGPDTHSPEELDQIPPESMAVPPPLSQAEIAAMDRNQAREAQGRIAKVLRRGSLSPEDRARLDQEFKQIMQHLRTIK